MDKWLAAAIEADENHSNLSAVTRVQKVQKVQQQAKTGEIDSYCTYRTNCTGENKQATAMNRNVPETWKSGFERLISMSCPISITDTYWQQFLKDADMFMSQWAEKAYAMGWSVTEVFGVHPTAPIHRPDAAGLVWLLNGSEIIAITADQAAVKTPTSNSSTIYRHAVGSVPAWELSKESG